MNDGSEKKVRRESGDLELDDALSVGLPREKVAVVHADDRLRDRDLWQWFAEQLVSRSHRKMVGTLVADGRRYSGHLKSFGRFVDMPLAFLDIES